MVNYQAFLDSAQFRAFVGETVRIAVAVPLGVVRGNETKDIRCVKLVDNEKPIVNYVDSEIWQTAVGINNCKPNEIEYDYIIPKGGFVNANLAYVSIINKDLWNGNDPMELNLSNWIDKENGNTFKKNEKCMTFSVGKRSCVGQALAMRELLGFLGHLILRYQILPANEKGVELKLNQDLVSVIEPEAQLVVKRRPAI